MKRHLFLICALLLTALAAATVAATEYYVKKDGTGDFTAIQPAINAAQDGDTIIVYSGTYYENIRFGGKNIVLRSVDPTDINLVQQTVINGGGHWSPVVSFSGTEDESCQISGFTITNGRPTFGGGIRGGPEFGDHTRAAISYCIITGNSAYDYGGGIYHCDGVISNCTICDNEARHYYGGGLLGCDGVISNCTISDNTAHTYGGGLDRCGAQIINCTISGNHAGLMGGGLYGCFGDITDSVISDNSSGEAAGLFGCDGNIINCIIANNAADDVGGGLECCDGTIGNCLIVNNSSNDGGGGVLDCYGLIINCTIADNWSSEGGGLQSCQGTIVNSIIWANSAASGAQLLECSVPSYCCIQDWTGGGASNITDDPLFVTGGLGDYYLACTDAGQASDSPCIDAGNDTAENLGLASSTTRTDNAPDTGVVDLGYHYITEGEPPPPPPNPTIECSLNDTEFSPGDTLVASLSGGNTGQQITVDVYLIIVLPDWSCFSYTDEGFVPGLAPWLTDLDLPQGYFFGPDIIFQLEIMEGTMTGTYYYVGLFSTPGEFNIIGDPSIVEFTITD